MTVINSNSAALRAQNGSRIANMQLSQAMARLSSGKRINSAADDAAGLAISNSMTSQISGMNQGIRNANDGISLAQTADGALDEVTNMLQRVRELAVQSASGTFTDSDRTNMQAEVSQLTTQIGNVLNNTTFNGVKLFNTAAGATPTTFKIQAGSTANDTITISVGGIDLSKTAATAPSAGGAAEVAGALDVASTNTTAGASNGVTNATNTMASVDSLLGTVNTVRAGLGASESQLNSAVNNLTNNVTNLTDARSRVQDADFSVETTNLAKAQILNQASTAMLAQANQSAQGVLKLLQ